MVVPLKLSQSLLIRSGLIEIASQIAFSLATPDEVRSFARLAFREPIEWVNTDHFFHMCLHSIIKLNDVELLAALVQSALLYEFEEEGVQERLMHSNLKLAVAHFSWDVRIPKILAAVTKRLAQFSQRSRVNLISNLAAAASATGTTIPVSDLFNQRLNAPSPTAQPPTAPPSINFLMGIYRGNALAEKLNIPRTPGVPELVRLFQLAYECDSTATTRVLLSKCIELDNVLLAEVLVPAIIEFADGIRGTEAGETAMPVDHHGCREDTGSKDRRQPAQRLVVGRSKSHTRTAG